jgi:TatD DNase family protein
VCRENRKIPLKDDNFGDNLVPMFVDAHTHNVHADCYAILQSSGLHIPMNCFSSGIHPWHADAYNENKDDFFRLIQHEKCVAIGETGLDKICSVDLETQKHVFREQILLSEKFRLPLILHCVRSWEETKKIFDQMNVSQRWVFHGFNKKGILEDVLKRKSIMISLGSKLCTDVSIQELILRIPSERLLLETDDSDTSIETVYTKAAQLLNISLDELKQKIHRNFAETFTKWQPG